MVKSFVQRVGSLTRLAIDIQELLGGYVPLKGLSLNAKCFILDSFLTNIFVLYPLRISENQKLSGVFRGYKIGTEMG